MTALPSARSRTTSVTVVGGEFEAEVVVSCKRLVADGVVTLDLSEVGGHPLPSWTPGAHIDLRFDLSAPSAKSRQYSLCGDPQDRSTWRVGILREASGEGTSRYVHDDLKVGDVIRIRGPRNHFALEPSPRYLFIAGGIGITPILAMIEQAEAAGAQWRLAYGGRERRSMAFLDELARYGERVDIFPHAETGLLPLDALLVPQADTLVYCCGPEPLLAAVEERCGAWPRDALHVERFAARPQEAPVLAGSFEVELTESELTLVVPPDRSILQVVEEAGVTVFTSCEEGTCGSCETAVVDGLPDHRDSVLSPSERAAGDCMMICVSRSCTPRLVLDL